MRHGAEVSQHREQRENRCCTADGRVLEVHTSARPRSKYIRALTPSQQTDAVHRVRMRTRDANEGSAMPMTPPMSRITQAESRCAGTTRFSPAVYGIAPHRCPG